MHILAIRTHKCNRGYWSDHGYQGVKKRRVSLDRNLRNIGKKAGGFPFFEKRKAEILDQENLLSSFSFFSFLPSSLKNRYI